MQIFQHGCDTACSDIVDCGISGTAQLYLLNFLDVLLGMCVPAYRGIFHHWTNIGPVAGCLDVTGGVVEILDTGRHGHLWLSWF